MSTVENLNQLSALLTISPSFSLPELLTNLALSAIAGFLIKYLFIYCSKTFSNKEAISENFILMTMTTTIVIFIVKSSLALSLGLVGALSIVRFRTAIKEPEELSYIFLCIATGVGLGAGQPIVILTSLGIISIILLLRKQVPNKRQSHSEMVLTLRFVTPQQLPKVIEQLDKADAHPYGSRPFKRQNYIQKFLTLTNSILDKKESNRFLKTVQNLRNLKSGQLHKLNIEVRRNKLKRNNKKGIF